MNNSNKKKVVVGIDLGTTNSVISVYDPLSKQVQIIEDRNTNSSTVPSVVYISPDEKDIVKGQIAKNKIQLEPENVISSVKWLIGEKANLKIGPKIKLSDGRYKLMQPETISSLILDELIKNLSNANMYTEHVVITVPAYFTESQRKKTRDAATLSGLNVLRLINEPTAAALAYIYDENNKNDKWFIPKKILVYDLGGGTFDVTTLDVSYIKNQPLIKVNTTEGDNKLGGDDFNHIIAKYVCEKIEEKHGINFHSLWHQNIDAKWSYIKILNAVEGCKIQLSKLKNTFVWVPLLQFNNSHINVEVPISRALFDDLTSSLIDKTFNILDKTLKEAKWTYNDVEWVLLVGGSTKILKIIERLKDKFTADKIESRINPDIVVAKGAAIKASIIASNKLKDASIINIFDKKAGNLPILLDVCSLSLGVEIQHGRMHKLINKNSTIPCSKTDNSFIPPCDFIDSIRCNIYQGERSIAKENHYLGSLNIPLDPTKKSFDNRLSITFNIDVNNMLKIKAKNLLTSKEVSVTIDAASKLSKDQIQQMIEDSEKYKSLDAENDKKFNELDRFSSVYLMLKRLSSEKNKESFKSNKDLEKWFNDLTSFYHQASNADFIKKIKVEEIKDKISKIEALRDDIFKFNANAAKKDQGKNKSNSDKPTNNQAEDAIDKKKMEEVKSMLDAAKKWQQDKNKS